MIAAIWLKTLMDIPYSHKPTIAPITAAAPWS